MPSRFGQAFPPEVEIERIGLADAIKEIRLFLNSETLVEDDDIPF